MDPIRIVGIAGSLRAGFTKQTVAIALEGARKAGAETELLDLEGLDVPVLPGGNDDAPADVRWLQEKVRDAHGIILGTPEYHGSYSGVLKNVLDWMGFDEFEGKVVGLVAVGGGTVGGIAAMEHLRTVMRALHAWVVPGQTGIPRAWKAFEDGLDDAMRRRVEAVGKEVTHFAALHHHERERFLEAWEKALENPGA